MQRNPENKIYQKIEEGELECVSCGHWTKGREGKRKRKKESKPGIFRVVEQQVETEAAF